MIAFLTGRVAHKGAAYALLEVGGVGYKLAMTTGSLAALPAEGDEVTVWTYLYVREDELSLFGFESEAEKESFEQLITVSGVGPKVSLAVLSTLTVETVQRAVMNEESEILGRVPGVGKRTAQNIVLHLHGKIRPSDALEQVAAMSDRDSEVLAALTALGYSVVEAQSAIQSLPKDAPEDTEERLRMALQYFQ